MEQRRSAALDKLRQVNAELRQVQQAVSAQSPRLRRLASLLQEERAQEAAEKASAAGSPQGPGGGNPLGDRLPLAEGQGGADATGTGHAPAAPQAESTLRRQMPLRGGRRDGSSGMATAAAAWLSSRPATPAAATPQLTRSPRGQRHGDASAMALVADAWLARHPAMPPGSPGAFSAGPAENPPHAPAAKPSRQVRFSHAEERTFGSDDAPGALASKGRTLDLRPPTGHPMTQDPVHEPPTAGPSAEAERAAKQAAKDTQTAVFTTLGRLQALETRDPARWQQARQDRRLPEDVLDPASPLDEDSMQEVFDLHQMFQEESPDTLQALFGESVLTAHHAREEALNPGAAQARAADLLAAALAPMDDEISAEPSTEPAQAAPAPGALSATGAPPPWQPLSDGERRLVAKALRGEGRAMRRMADRAARADLALSPGPRAGLMRRLGPGAPRPLEGQRRDDFLALMDKDIAALAAHAKLDEPAAAALLLRAVTTGAIGATLRKDDRVLVLAYLDRRAPQEPAQAIPWAKDAMAGWWWSSLTDEHRDAIRHGFAQAGDTRGNQLLQVAPEGRAADMQALHDHLFEHYRFRDDGSLHHISNADTGQARNHIGLMTQAGEPPTGEPSAEDLHNAALQAELEKIYAANDLAKKKYRHLRGL